MAEASPLAVILLLLLAAGPAPAAPVVAQPMSRQLAEQIDGLITALGDEDGLHAAHAMRQLIDLGDLVLPQLLQALASSSEAVAIRIVTILGAIGNDSVVDAIHAEILDRTDPFRVVAADALCQLGSTAGITLMLYGLEHDSPEIRLRSIAGLRRHTRQNFGYRFSDPPEARRRAIEAWRSWWARNVNSFTLPVPSGEEPAEGDEGEGDGGDG